MVCNGVQCLELVLCLETDTHHPYSLDRWLPNSCSNLGNYRTHSLTSQAKYSNASRELQKTAAISRKTIIAEEHAGCRKDRYLSGQIVILKCQATSQGQSKRHSFTTSFTLKSVWPDLEKECLTSVKECKCFTHSLWIVQGCGLLGNEINDYFCMRVKMLVLYYLPSSTLFWNKHLSFWNTNTDWVISAYKKKY